MNKKNQLGRVLCAMMCLAGTSLHAETIASDSISTDMNVDSVQLVSMSQSSEDAIVIPVDETVVEPVAANATEDEAMLISAEPEKRMNIFRRFAKAFGARDPEYLDPMKYELVVRPQNVEFFQNYKVSVKDDEGNVQSIRMSPHHAVKFGVALGWRWLVLGYSINVAEPRKDRNLFEFSFNLHSRMLALDLLLINHKAAPEETPSEKIPL